jgi:hypothetical protein
MREMKPWEVVVDRIGKSLMRLIALSLVAGYCMIAYAEWPSMEFLMYSPIVALFLYYGLRGEGGLAKIGRSDLNETGKAAARINGQRCSHCGHHLEGITHRDLGVAGIKPNPLPGTKVDWDRMPHRSVQCPACGGKICFDLEHRPIDCSGGDAIRPGPEEAGPRDL